MTKITAHPLRAIVARPTQLTEQLECGHIINRPLGLGEFAMEPSKAQRRRCYHCQPETKPAKAPAKRSNQAVTWHVRERCAEWQVVHGNKIMARFASEDQAVNLCRERMRA